MFGFLFRIVAGLLVAPALAIFAVVLAVLGVWAIVWIPLLIVAALVALAPLLGVGRTMRAGYAADLQGRQIVG